MNAEDSRKVKNLASNLKLIKSKWSDSNIKLTTIVIVEIIGSGV